MNGHKRRILSAGGATDKFDSNSGGKMSPERENKFLEDIDISLGEVPSQVYHLPASNNVKTDTRESGRKFRGRPKRSLGEDMYSWPDHAILLLIKEWEEHDVLYNPKNPNYHVKEAMEEAVEEICTVFHEKSISLTPKQVTNKMLSLKNYFCKERAKVNQSKRIESNENSIYRVNWRFFEPMQFLDDCIIPKPTYLPQENKFLPSFTNPHFDTSLTNDHESRNRESNYINNTTQKSSSLSSYQQDRIKEADDKCFSLAQRETNIPHQNKLSKDVELCNIKSQSTDSKFSYSVNSSERDEDDVFCELILKMLKKLPAGESKEMLKLNIQHMIIQANFRGSTLVDSHDEMPWKSRLDDL